MFDQPCASSFAKGYGIELIFIDQLESKGCEVKKIKDHDKSKRYDLLAEKNNKKITFEVKTLQKGKKSFSVGVGYKDTRSVELPSGRKWSTKCRAVREKFDFLAVCLVNCDEFSVQDFIYIPFKDIPNKKITKGKFTIKDREFIESNYLASSISIEKSMFENVNKLCFS
jgi:hypothetical protein